MVHIRQVHHDSKPIERNVLCGIDDAREIAVGVIVFDGGSEMQMNGIKVAG